MAQKKLKRIKLSSLYVVQGLSIEDPAMHSCTTTDQSSHGPLSRDPAKTFNGLQIIGPF